MGTIKVDLAQFRTPKDLKSMLESEGPSLSIFMSLNGRTNPLAWKELLRGVQPKLQDGKELLEGLPDWNTLSQDQPPHCKALALFRSRDLFRMTWLATDVKSRAILGPQFYIRPLLQEVTRPRVFYILALSQRNIRLLRCTASKSEEVSLPPGAPTSYDAYMNSAQPDHVRDTRSSAGPSSGSSKGIIASFGTEREDKGEHLGHFYHQIDLALNETLRGKTDPVVIAGVEYETALYRTLNTYQHLAEEAVHGAPNSLKAGEMHARALEAIAKCYANKVVIALAEYNHKVGGGASNRVKDVVPAAHDGRVLTLLVSDSIERTGSFDESTHSVKNQGIESGDEDLVNDAAVQTILHAGNVLVVPDEKMPDGSPVAAIYRF